MFVLCVMAITITKISFVIIQTVNALKMLMILTVSTYHKYDLILPFEKFLLEDIK